MNDSPTWYTPYNLGVNYIRYSPNAACGGSLVNIENRATKALYNYTPYQPNQAALNAGWGSAACGAYGNRNFYLYLTNWFNNSSIAIPPTVYIPDGVYTLSNQASTKNMDVLSASTANGASVGIYTKNNTAAQRWIIRQQPDGYYSLTNVNSGKVLDVTGGSRNTGVKLQTYTNNSTCAQRWSFVSDNSNVSLLNKCTQLAVDVTNGNTTNSTKLQTYIYNGTNAQRWDLSSFEPQVVANGIYTIALSKSGLALDITGGNYSNGTRIQIYDKNNTKAQQWQITRQPDGFYTIYNPTSGKSLDVADARVTRGTAIQLYAKNFTCAQKWSITGSDNVYSIQPSCSTKYALDVADGNINTSGNRVQLYTRNLSNAQLWLFHQ